MTQHPIDIFVVGKWIHHLQVEVAGKDVVLPQVQLCQHNTGTGEKRQQPQKTGLCCPWLCCAPCNQMTSKRSENWEDNSTTLPCTQGLCFLGCSGGVDELHVRCWKCCTSHKEHWLSSGARICFYLDFKDNFQSERVNCQDIESTILSHPHATSPDFSPCPTEYKREENDI